MFNVLSRRRASTGYTGLVVQGAHACAATITRPSGAGAELSACTRLVLDAADSNRGLKQLSADRGASQPPLTCLLNADDYQLLLVEAPEVQPEELRAAVRWRIKDLINFHVDDAAIDVFDIPGQSHRGQNKMMYAVAARASAVQACANRVLDAGLPLAVIDIPEMALRNLAALHPADTNGLAMLHLEQHHGFITLTRGQTLYLARHLDHGWQALQRTVSLEGLLDNIVLEIQRSLDYYESHYDTAAITELVVTPTPEPLPALLEHLNARLDLNVTPYVLTDLLRSQTDHAGITPALLAIGAALRQEARTL